MTNPNYIKGRKAEYKTIGRLRLEGYYATRSAGSHHLWDVQAYLESGKPSEDKPYLRLIQVKAGTAKISKPELLKLKLAIVPPQARKEIWWWATGASEPEIEVV